MMKVIGLTGSIGMGKSTVAKMFRARGLAHWDADLEVKNIYAQDAVPFFQALYPEFITNGYVDRDKIKKGLKKGVISLKGLEAVVLPILERKMKEAIRKARYAGEKAIILDVPLLFEAGWERLCDEVVVVSCPAFLQLQRIQKRDKRPVAETKALISRQMPDWKKRRKADVVIPTGNGMAATRRAINKYLSEA